MEPADLLVNLPEQLTKEDLKNDITVSNENRPTDNSSNKKQQ